MYGIVQSLYSSEGFLLCELLSPSPKQAQNLSWVRTQVFEPSVKMPLETRGRSWQSVCGKVRPLIIILKKQPSEPIRAIVTTHPIFINHISDITKQSLSLTSTKSVELEETIPHFSLFVSRCGVWRARANINRPVCPYQSAGIRH